MIKGGFLGPYTSAAWRCVVGTAAAAVLCASNAVSVYGQAAANVAVVINEESPASTQIGEHYARTRGVPESNIIRIRTKSEEAISRAAYGESIERPIALALSARGLQDRILYLVLTKGVPLRISGTAGRTGTAASVDAELTLLYRRMTGRDVSTVGPIDNPVYLGDQSIADATPFSHRDYDIYLVTRLDAFTVAEALALIDRAQAPSVDGRILLDRRGEAASVTGDLWLVEASTKLKALGHGGRVELVETPAATPTADGVMGYYSWGSNDPANRRRRLGLQFLPGSIGATLAGTDARTFTPPPDAWEPGANLRDRTTWFADAPQSLVGDLIRDGLTGVAGNVAEPLLASSIRPQVLFPAYLSGANLAEAFYRALPHLSWQSVVIGDPLCRPFAGRVLTASEIEDPVDERTGLPGLFAKRRLDAVRAVLTTAPPDAIPLIVRAQEHLAQGRKEAARKTFEEVTTLAPDLADPHMQLALLYEETNLRERAIEQYRRVVALQPRNAAALNNLAYRLAEDQRALAEALPLARRAAALAPGNPKILDTVGWIHHLAAEHAEAAKFVLEAARLDPNAAEIRLHAAVVSFAIGSYKTAQSHLDAAVRLDPVYDSRDDVRELRADLLKRR